MATVLFDNQDPALVNAARKIAAVIANAGHTVCFAGGCVRDGLLGRPIHDIDIATSAKPDEIERLFKGHTVAVGKSFGIIVVRQDNLPFDVATFRADGAYADGRHPDSITFATPEGDAQRRDFTVNGLFCDPFTGVITDYVGGVEDIADKRIRAIGDPEQRFAEDHLRMFRAIRFASVIGFSIEPKTLAAIKAHANWLATVSAERISAEMTRLLCESPKPSIGLTLLRTTGLLKIFLPEVNALYGVRQPPKYHPEGDVWTHTMLMLDDEPAPRTPEVAWSLLLHDVGKPPTFTEAFEPALGEKRIRFMGHADVGTEMAETILRRLKMPNALIETVCAVVHSHMRFCDATQMRGAKLRRFMGTPYFPVLLKVIREDLLHSCGELTLWDFLNKAYTAYKNEPVLPPAIVTGKDLIAWGYKPGAEMGELLRRLYDAQLEDAFKAKDEARGWLARN
jgi:tRNA nucleotidyltransferase/poly(A) polymerase